MPKRQSFKLIIPAHPHKNVFSAIASRMTSLGPIMVATCVNKSFTDVDVEVIDENNYKGPRDENGLPDHKALQEQKRANFVGFYCGLTSTMPRVFELVKYYKPQGALLIAGGIHAASLPEESLRQGFNVVVRGEGEKAMVDIIRAIKNNSNFSGIGGISYWDNGKIIHNDPKKIELKTLEDLPHPDFGLMRWAKKMLFYPIGRTRGCSRRCEFCTVKSQPRWSSPEKTIDDIAWLAQTRKAKYFFIVDDRLNEDDEGTRNLFKSLIKAKEEHRLPKNLSFTVQIRLEAARENDLLELMRLAGVDMVCIGYESPIAAELNAMKKGIKPEDMIEYTKIFKRAGFWVHAMFIFGYPTQTQAERLEISAAQKMKEFKNFIKKAKPDTIQVLLATPIPGTEMYARLENENRIYPREIFGWENYDGAHLCFEPDAPMSALEVQQCPIDLMKWFYSGWSFWKIPLLILAFPFMIPFGFTPWSRLWRNSIWGCIGYKIIKDWMKTNKKEELFEKFLLVRKKLAM